MAKHTLFEDATGTGDSTIFVWSGGVGSILIVGTIGTYAGTGEISEDGTNFVALKDLNGVDIVLSGEKHVNFYAPTDARIKVNNGTMTSTTITGTLYDDKV